MEKVDVHFLSLSRGPYDNMGALKHVYLCADRYKSKITLVVAYAICLLLMSPKNC